MNLSTRQPALRRTRSFALAASVLLVMGLTALLYWRGHQTIRATVVATISAKAGEHIWELEVFGSTQRLVVHAVRLPARPAGRDYELWALPKGGSPVSLGVLPIRDVSSRTLSAMQKQALANSSEVAVTLEAHGGSPTRPADRRRPLRGSAARGLLKTSSSAGCGDTMNLRFACIRKETSNESVLSPAMNRAAIPHIN